MCLNRLRDVFLLTLMLTPGLLFGQGANTLTLRFNGAPTGACSPFMYAVNNLNGDFYDCLSGVWFLVATGTGSTAWSSLTGGTNSNAGTFAASGNTWNFSDVTSFKFTTVHEQPAGAVNGINVTYTMSHTADPTSLKVQLNGLVLSEGAGNDYTVSGTTITMNYAPGTGDSFQCWYNY